MISSEILKSVRPETVKSLWPEIIDIDEVQTGGCPEFWNRYFPGRIRYLFCITAVFGLTGRCSGIGSVR